MVIIVEEESMLNFYLVKFIIIIAFIKIIFVFLQTFINFDLN